MAHCAPSTSRDLSPQAKRVKTEIDFEENFFEPILPKSEIEDEISEEEVIIKDEIKEEEAENIQNDQIATATQTEGTDIGIQTEATRDFYRETIERLLDQVKPKKKPVNGTKINISDSDILQFTITLVRGRGAPRIWRRFKVPANYNFRQFHIAIQKVMGWKSVLFDYHLHAFRIVNPATEYEEEIVMTEDCSSWSSFENTKDENLTQIKDYFNVIQHFCRYDYDFGCGWEHVIVFNGPSAPVPGEKYPVCLQGAKNCPPEDGCVHSDEEYDSDAFDPDKCFD